MATTSDHGEADKHQHAQDDDHHPIDVGNNINNNNNNNNTEESALNHKSEHSLLAPLSVLQVSGRGTHVTQGLPDSPQPPSSWASGFPSDSPSNHWSHDGTYMVVVEKDAVCVVDAASGAVHCRLPVAHHVHAAYFSPTDRFVITYRRYSSRYTEPNLCVFRVSDGQAVLSAEQRVWPALAWSRNDAFLVRTTTLGDGVEVYRVGDDGALECANSIHVEQMIPSAKDNNNKKKKKKEKEKDDEDNNNNNNNNGKEGNMMTFSSQTGPRIGSVAIGGRSNNPPVAVFIASREDAQGKGKVAVFRTLSLIKAKAKDKDKNDTNSKRSSGGKPLKAISRLNVEQADKCTFAWNQQGSALLVRIASDVDVSHRSYYGQTALFILPSTTGNASFSRLVEQDSIHDAAWSPDGQQFVVVHGSPSKSSLFSVRGKMVFEFGHAAHNTALWSPSGRFLLLGGFGNMSGAMTFWDIKTRTVLGKTNADSACECSWAPGSRHVLTATTMPRMQVDNKIVVFDWTGNVVFRQEYDRLYHAEWQPVSADRLPPPPSPRTLKEARRAQKKAEAAAPKKYTPPHARRDVSATNNNNNNNNTENNNTENNNTDNNKEQPKGRVSVPQDKTLREGDNENKRGRGRGRGKGRGRGRGGGRGRGRGRDGGKRRGKGHGKEGE